MFRLSLLARSLSASPQGKYEQNEAEKEEHAQGQKSEPPARQTKEAVKGSLKMPSPTDNRKQSRKHNTHIPKSETHLLLAAPIYFREDDGIKETPYGVCFHVARV
ncbi:hypothetical protein STEG23_010654 [Scotinomys teguina]